MMMIREPTSFDKESFLGILRDSGWRYCLAPPMMKTSHALMLSFSHDTVDDVAVCSPCKMERRSTEMETYYIPLPGMAKRAAGTTACISPAVITGKPSTYLDPHSISEKPPPSNKGFTSPMLVSNSGEG